ncbi:Hypothetical_protein [Hexamita inflata]|uniref:Hypothetical_protein n=1 Tax=Hexamita inflata TaxID=28002 RepID=A0AA86R8H0_9EUKA|nr:Hypothetical protein HINF_LOCUS60996 [Hexamita inflata]
MFNLLFAIVLSTSTFADETHADIIIINQQEQNITLKAAQSIIVGVKVPPAVTAGGQTITYSQFAFQAMSAMSGVTSRNYIFFSSLDNSTNYAVFKNRDMFVFFSVSLSQQQNENQEYIYINVTSTCDIQMRLGASAVHQLDSQTYSLTKVSPESTFFVHKQVPGVNKRVKFEIDSYANYIIWVCSFPKVLRVIMHDCRFLPSEGGSIIDANVNITNYDVYKDCIYYSIEHSGDGNDLIKASIVDVNEIDVDSHQNIQIRANTPLHYQFHNDLPKDAYFEVLNIGPGVELCFTDDFEYPENVKCKKSLNQSGKFNITEMNFLVQSQGAGRLEFQVKVCGSEKKDNNQWIVWVAAAGVLVAVGISVCVFFFMRHNKQTNIHKNEENEAIVAEK